jgi:invasion protein IalB
MRTALRLFLASVVVSVTLAGAGLAQVPGMGEQERYADWTVFCPANADCTAIYRGTAVRLVVGPNAASGDLRVAVLVAANADRSKPVFTMLSALGGDTPARRIAMNISSCNSGFCKALASAETAPQVIDLFRNSRRGRVVYAINEGRTVAAPVSFTGFAYALAKVESHAGRTGQ